ncbi:MAG: hypothetical protein P1P83_00960 [Bacteroidales bacterium]|nr:hypothetical protein [Bacteroidales bacterium]MDT8372593.1 hypothetical protein [Bacteroidales bacterium]
MSRFKYHHLGIPTKRKLPEKDYIPHLKLFASGFEESPYGIEWMNFDEDCRLPDLVKSVPHIAFVVDDLGEALKEKEIIIEPNSPSKGTTVAFIVENGAPIELLQFDSPEDEFWPEKALYR